MGKSEKDRHSRALGILTRLQRTIVRRLTGFVIENEDSLRQAAEGTEGYGYTMHQLDELFLSRLNLVERTIAELQKSPIGGVSRYRSICFRASQDDVEKAINSRLEKLREARILGVSVSPASANPGAAVAARRPAASAPKGGREAGRPGAELLVSVLYYGPAYAPDGE